MSRSFTFASSQKLEYSGAVISAAPLTLACWCYFPSLFSSGSGTQWGLMGVGATANSSAYQLWLSDSSGPKFWALAQNSSGSSGWAATDVADVNSNTWTHAAAVFSSTTSRGIYRDGVLRASDTHLVSGFNFNTTTVGMTRSGSNKYSTSSIAEAAIWSVALTDAEIATLAAGVSPLLVRPASLEAYWPLLGNTSPEIDLVGSYSMSLTGSPVAGNHCRVYYPAATLVGFPAQAAAGGSLAFRRLRTASLYPLGCEGVTLG